MPICNLSCIYFSIVLYYNVYEIYMLYAARHKANTLLLLVKISVRDPKKTDRSFMIKMYFNV